MILKLFLAMIKGEAKKQWRKETAKCNKCGNKWTVVFPKGGPENKLECPKCKARDSKII